MTTGTLVVPPAQSLEFATMNTISQAAELPTTPSGLTFTDPATQLCPFNSYDQLREGSPVYLDPVTGHYVLTRYPDVRKALLNHRTFSSDANLIGRRQNSVTEEVSRLYRERGWARAESFQLMDEPEHKRKRSLVDKAFSHWNIQAITPYIEELCDRLIDSFIDRGECDFVSEFAVKLTMRVIAKQLGVEPNPNTFDQDVEKLRFWSDCAIEVMSPTITAEREIELTHDAIEFQHFCARNIARVRARPDETLLSELVGTVVDENGEPNIVELLAVVRALLVAGNETTRFALAAGVKMMIDRPSLVFEILQNQKALDAFAEEVLRVMSPIQTLFRRALEPVVIDGITIPAGARVEVRFGAANRDPAIYFAPDQVSLCRQESPHLAFGMGIHGCIGMQLARAEMRIAFQRLLRRLKNLRAARGEQSYAFTSMYISHGLIRLDLAFDQVKI
jgi:cytochrome P450